jgi:chaperonin GroES
MLELERPIKLTEEVCNDLDLTHRFSEKDLQSIGEEVWAGYQADEQSRGRWLRRTQAAMDLAMQVQEAKTFPWANCSNVAFPLITIAALQWHARAYPELLGASEWVKFKTFGEDPDGKKMKQANKISAHMSFQLTEEDSAWEEEMDRGLLNEAIVGTIFKKSIFSASMGHNLSELVLAKDLVLNYYSKSVETAPRKTHCYPLTRNEIYERVRREQMRDVLKEEWFHGMVPPSEDLQRGVKADVRRGVEAPATPDSLTPFKCLEQHVSMDLDADGYAEPYVITILEECHVPLRIVTRFEWQHVQRNNRNQVISIRALEHFTKYGFIPNPDGGVYDVGFGVLLGPINESVNTNINQLNDAGTMATTAGGFLGRGVKFRSGQNSFSPFGWNRMDSTGEDIGKGVVPLPVREPSAVLFQLLTLMIDYANRIAGTTDVMVGENPGQNTPKYNMQAMQQEGSRIYNAIFKRQWRCMKDEFEKLFVLNGTYLPLSRDPVFGVSREDYLGDPRAIRPSADPNLTSSAMRMEQASILATRALQVGGYNKDEVERNLLRAARVEAIDVFYPGLDKIPPPPNPHVLVAQIKAEGDKAKAKGHLAEFLAKIESERELNKAKIVQLEAQAAKALMDADDADAMQRLAEFEAKIDAFKDIGGIYQKHVELLIKQTEAEKDEQGPGGGGAGGMAKPSGNAGGAKSPAPAA